MWLLKSHVEALFLQVFAQMIHVGVGVDFHLVHSVLEYLLDELERDRERLRMKKQDDAYNDVCECNIHTALYLFIIMCKVKVNGAVQAQIGCSSSSI